MSSGNSSDSRIVRQQSWAQKQLGLDDAQVTTADARASLLKSLRDSDYLPVDDTLSAFELLTDKRDGDQALPKGYLRDEIEELESAIGAFAKGMFALPPEERHAGWKELNTQCRDVPRMMARVELLTRGLDIDATAHLNEPDPVRQLASHLLELFVLPPIEKARRRGEIMESYENNFGEFVQAASSIAEHFPDFKALDPEFIDDVQTWSMRAAKAETERRKSSQSVQEDEEVAPYDQAFTGPVPNRRLIGQKRSNQINPTLATVLVIGFIIAIGLNSMRDRPYRDSNRRNYQLPEIKEPRFDFSDFDADRSHNDTPNTQTKEQMQILIDAIRNGEIDLTPEDDFVFPDINSKTEDETTTVENWKHIFEDDEELQRMRSIGVDPESESYKLAQQRALFRAHMKRQRQKELQGSDE